MITVAAIRFSNSYIVKKETAATYGLFSDPEDDEDDEEMCDQDWLRMAD